MSIFEYNKEEEERKLRKAEYEAGYDSGYDSGKEAGYDLGRKEEIEKMAEKMLETGKYTAKDISEVTGLSYDQLQSLKSAKIAGIT